MVRPPSMARATNSSASATASASGYLLLEHLFAGVDCFPTQGGVASGRCSNNYAWNFRIAQHLLPTARWNTKAGGELLGHHWVGIDHRSECTQVIENCAPSSFPQ